MRTHPPVGTCLALPESTTKIKPYGKINRSVDSCPAHAGAPRGPAHTGDVDLRQA